MSKWRRVFDKNYIGNWPILSPEIAETLKRNTKKKEYMENYHRYFLSNIIGKPRNPLKQLPKIYVLCGDIRQFEYWQNMNPHYEGIYLRMGRFSNQLDGIPRGKEYVCYGTYYSHPERIEMLDYLRAREFIRVSFCACAKTLMRVPGLGEYCIDECKGYESNRL